MDRFNDTRVRSKHTSSAVKRKKKVYKYKYILV